MAANEQWQGWKNGKRARVYPSRGQADNAIRRREIDCASPIKPEDTK